MKNLYQYITEGGASGHMAHPYDYDDYTLRDLKGLIRRLFEGRIEDITEKIDGTNIQATVNNQGEVVFIRNKGDLNSAQGGMSISDMASKWASNPHVANTFVTAGETIIKVFSSIPNKFFNPDKNTKRVVNCECVIAGKTNVMPYASDQVDFHDIWIYKWDGNEWVKDEVTKKGLDIIEKACEKVDRAQITPQLIIKTNEDCQKILVDYIKRLDRIFKDAKCSEYSTVGEWKKSRFLQYCKDNTDQLGWILKSEEGINALFNRWFNRDKSLNIKKICEFYPEDESTIRSVDKGEYKKWIDVVMKPMDEFFIELGNNVIKLCDGIINQGSETQTIQQLTKDIQDIVKDIESSDDEDAKNKMFRHLNRLDNQSLNPTEGIVFRYKGKLQKLTGSFAPLNALLGLKKFNR